MEPVHETITPEKLLDKFFIDSPKMHRYSYMVWTTNTGEEKIFVRKTNKGNHWLYKGDGSARRALIECIYELGEDNPLRVPDRDYPRWNDHRATTENVEWYVDELIKRGIIQFRHLESWK